MDFRSLRCLKKMYLKNNYSSSLSELLFRQNLSLGQQIIHFVFSLKNTRRILGDRPYVHWSAVVP